MSKELDQEFLSLSTLIKGLLVGDATTGVVTGDKNVYATVAPTDDVPLSLLEKADARNNLFMRAGAHAFGEISVELRKANPQLTETSLHLPMLGRNALDGKITTLKSGEVNGKSYTKHGVLQLQYTHSAVRVKSGTMKQIAEGIAAEYEKLAN
jgi:hypothetical protein